MTWKTVKLEWRQLYNDQPANVADKVQVPDTRRAGASHGRSSQVQVLSLCQILRKPWSTLNLRIGDPVWAKMKGFSPWPGKVCLPPTDCKRPAGGVTYSLKKKLLADILTLSVKKQMHCVMFFGTNDYAWIEEVLCCKI